MRFLCVTNFAYPDGTRDLFGVRFWNATNACCDFYSSGVDDSGHLRDLIDEIRSRVDVDDDRTQDYSRGVIEFFLDHPKPGASPRQDIQGIAAEVPTAEESEAARQEIGRGAAVLEALSERVAD